MNTELLVRKFCERDINYVMDIYLKSYYYTMPVETWQEISEDKDCYQLVAIRQGVPVGFAMWRRHRHPTVCELTHIGVSPSERGSGAGTALLDAVAVGAIQKHLDKIFIVVPEINCSPGDSDDSSVWLREHGFAAVLPVLKDKFTMYGRKVDGYRFERALA